MADRVPPFIGIVFGISASVALLASVAVAQEDAPIKSSAKSPPPQMTAVGGMELVSTVPDARQRLASLSVEDATGIVVGRVEDVRIVPGGHASAIKVALAPPAHPGQTVSLRADELSLDTGKDVIVSQLNASQVAARAGIPSFTPATEASGGWIAAPVYVDNRLANSETSASALPAPKT